MAKSMGKNCLKAMFAVLMATCFALWGIGMSGYLSATADGEDPWITAYDSSHAYTQEDDENVLTYVTGEIRTLYASVQNDANLVLDTDEYALASTVAKQEMKIASSSADYNAIAEDMLNGRKGLAGIRLIAEKTYAFYGAYVADSAYTDPTSEVYALSAANQASVKAEARRYISGFRLSESRFTSSDYDVSAAETYYDAFSDVIARYAEDGSLASNIERNKQTVETTYATYHAGTGEPSPKYDEAKVSEADRAGDDKETVLSRLDAAKSVSEANAIAQAYVERYSGIPSYMTDYFNAVSAAEAEGGYVVRAKDDEATQAAAKAKAEEIMNLCQRALTFYDTLAESYHDYNDDVNASAILNIYKKTAKTAVDNVKTITTGDYGVVAEEIISDNALLAKKMIDALDKAGKTDGVCGNQIVEKFAASYQQEGALNYQGESSSVPLSKISTVFGKCGDYKIFVTAIDDAGNPVKDFDADAKLVIREGVLPAVERNVNVMLGAKNLEEKIASANAAEVKEELAGKHLDRYFTITVYENDLVREEFGKKYRVTVEFKSDDALAEFKDQVNVIQYYHTTITNAVALSDIEWIEGEGVMSMTYTTDNFTQFGLVDQTKWTDWALIALIAFLALIVIIVAIAIIVHAVRNRKFSVRFDANRGKGTKILHVKLHEKFSYPANPVRKGYVFMGWYTDKECETRFASTELTVKGNMAVFAKWITEEEYKELKEQEAVAAPKSAADGDRKDRLDKYAAEKLEYEAKKAEEERKAEEARLEALKQIEESKNNEEARLQAEREAEEAKAEKNAVVAERDILIEKAREDERRKWQEERQTREDQLRAEIDEAKKMAEEARLIAETTGRVGIIGTPAETVVVDEARIREEIEEKIRAEEEARKQAEEENRRFREEESARLRAEIEKEMREEEEAKKKAEEEKAAMRAEFEALLKKELDDRAAAEAKAEEEKAALRAEIESMLAKELEAKAEAEAQAKAAAEEEERRKQEEEEARRRAEEEEKERAAREEAERLALLAKAEEEAKKAEEEKYDLAHAFDLLKAEIYSYTKANDLPFALDETTGICSLKQTDDAVILEVNEPVSDLAAKGYPVAEGETFAAAVSVTNEDSFNGAIDLIEDVMYGNGMKKTQKAVVTEATEETRKQGFVYEVKAERVADSVEDYFKLIRVYAKSFVLADQPEGETEEKTLIKMFVARGKLFVYLASENESLMQADESFAAEGLKSFMIVNTIEGCKEAIATIGEMMKENGLVRYPTDHMINEEGTEKGFNYVLKA